MVGAGRSEYAGGSLAFGDYYVEQDDRGVPAELGREGFGIVYRAQHRFADGVFAVKVLDPIPGNVGGARARFENELAAARMVRSSHVARPYEWDLAASRPWIAMQHVPGVTLEVYVRQAGGQLPLADAVRVTRQLADAIVDLARAGVVHRDLKPSNVIVSPGLAVTVIDLGLALYPGADRVTVGAVGTLAFMSPERLSERDQQPAADMWSLGVILAKLAGGRLPFVADSVQATMELICGGPADLRGLPWALRPLTRTLLLKRAEMRPSPERAALALEFLECAVAELASKGPPDVSLRAAWRWAIASGDVATMGELEPAYAAEVRSGKGIPWRPGEAVLAGGWARVGDVGRALALVEADDLGTESRCRVAAELADASEPDSAIALVVGGQNEAARRSIRRHASIVVYQLADAGFVEHAVALADRFGNDFIRFLAVSGAARLTNDAGLITRCRGLAAGLSNHRANLAYGSLVEDFGLEDDVIASLDLVSCAVNSLNNC